MLDGKRRSTCAFAPEGLWHRMNTVPLRSVVVFTSGVSARAMASKSTLISLHDSERLFLANYLLPSSKGCWYACPRKGETTGAERSPGCRMFWAEM